MVEITFNEDSGISNFLNANEFFTDIENLSDEMSQKNFQNSVEHQEGDHLQNSLLILSELINFYPTRDLGGIEVN